MEEFQVENMWLGLKMLFTFLFILGFTGVFILSTEDKPIKVKRKYTGEVKGY